MPPADPKLYTILDRVRADLAAITAGADYHYTPHLVKVVRAWDEVKLDTSLGLDTVTDPPTVYFVRREDRHIERDSTGDATNGDRPEATVDVSVLVCRRNTPSTDADTPTEALILERMLADVHRKLAFEDPGLGSSIDSDDVYAEGGVDDTVIENAPEGWICAQVTFRVAYQYFSSRP